MRHCDVCSFQTHSEKKDWFGPAEELAAMSDHLATHNPSPAQWAWAYHRMQRSKELGKPCECQECKKVGF